MMTISLHLTPKHAAECVSSANAAWITVDNGSLDDFSLFLPRGIPTQKVEAIAKAINDALEAARIGEAA